MLLCALGCGRVGYQQAGNTPPGDASAAPDVDADVPGPADPLPVTAGLLLWLDADDEPTVDLAAGVWRDKSGASRDAVQPTSTMRPAAAPAALNGRPAVRFDGGDDSLAVENADGAFDTDDLSVFLVVVPRWTMLLNPGNPSPFAIRDAGDVNRISIHVAADLGNFHSWNGDTRATSGAALVQGQAYLLGFVWDGEVEYHSLDGAILSSHVHAFGPAALAPTREGAAEEAWEHFLGDIAEIIVYGRALGAGEIDAVEAYVEEKWAIDTSP